MTTLDYHIRERGGVMGCRGGDLEVSDLKVLNLNFKFGCLAVRELSCNYSSLYTTEPRRFPKPCGEKRYELLNNCTGKSRNFLKNWARPAKPTEQEHKLILKTSQCIGNCFLQ